MYKISSNEPSALEQLSSHLTALACDFVFKANTNIYSIYPALREARRLTEGCRQMILMSTQSFGTIFLSFFISEVLLGIDSKKVPLLNNYHTLLLILVIIPVTSLLCLARPWDLRNYMTRSVINRRFREYLEYQLQTVMYTLMQTVYAALLINVVRLVNLYFLFCHPFEGSRGTKFLSLVWSRYGGSGAEMHIDETHFNFFMVLIILALIQIGKEAPLVSIIGFF